MKKFLHYRHLPERGPCITTSVGRSDDGATFTPAIVIHERPMVSFFTRDQGKLRGIARRARRPKSSFGSGLERLSHANVSYYQKENRERVSLNSCELVHSQFTLASNYEASVALDYLAEVTEQLLPPNETNERHLRLLIACPGLPRRQPAIA